MSSALALAPDAGSHPPREDFVSFVATLGLHPEYARRLLLSRDLFVEAWPDLRVFEQQPLEVRLGRRQDQAIPEARNVPAYRARRYITFLAAEGLLRLDWDWLLSADLNGYGLRAGYAHRRGAITYNDLVEMASKLGYTPATAHAMLNWAVSRMLLWKGVPDIACISAEDIVAARAAINVYRADHFGPGGRQPGRHWLASMHTLHVTLFHLGLLGEEPTNRAKGRPAAAYVMPSRMEAVIARWIERHLAIGQAETSMLRLRAAMVFFVKWVVERYPDIESFEVLTRADAEDFLSYMRTYKSPRTGKTLATTTKLGHISSISMFFRETAEWEWEGVPGRPLFSPADYPSRSKPVPRFIPKLELTRLMNAVDEMPCPYQRTALLVARWSGARRGEITGLHLDCLDEYDGGTARLRIPLGKTRTERMVPLAPQAAEAVADLIALRRRHLSTERPLLDRRTGAKVHYLFFRRGQRLTESYLFDGALLAACTTAGLVDGLGRPTVTAHRFRHTVGTELAERGARTSTIMKILGHESAQMSQTYVEISDPTVVKKYERALLDGVAGPAVELMQSATLPESAVAWLENNYFRTELELGRCIRLPEEGPCECDLFLTCSKFFTTSEYLPRLKARVQAEDALAARAEANGWAREVERHTRTRERLGDLIRTLEPAEPPSDTSDHLPP